MVKPASSVLRTLGIARMSFIAGSSCTELIRVLARPTHEEVQLHVHEPRQQGEVAELDDLGVVGDALGRDVADALALHDHHTRLDDRALVDVDHAVGLEHDRVVRRLRPLSGHHRGGHGVGSPTRSRYAAPESGTCGCFQHSTANDTEINE